MLIGQVDKTLNQTLLEKKITYGFKVLELWPLNPKTTNDKALHGEVYITCIKHQTTTR
jgi:hypothetical protein